MAQTDVFSQAFAKRVLDSLVSSANQSAVVPQSGGSPNLNVTLSTAKYVAGMPIAFVSGIPPTSTPQVVNNTPYYILSNTGSAITISTTVGGTAITFSTTGTSPVIAPAWASVGPLYLALINMVTMPTTDNATLTEFTAYTDTNNAASATTRPAINFGLVTPTGGVATQSIATTNAPTYAITGTDTIYGIAITTVQTKGTTLTTTSGTGDVVWYGSINSSVSVVNTDTLTFNIGQVTLSLG